MKKREALFLENDLFLPAKQATTPPPRTPGDLQGGIGAAPLVPDDHRAAAQFNIVAFWYDLRDRFGSLLENLSDCAERKAFFGDTPLSDRSAPSSIFEDLFSCQCCGHKTRYWVISQPDAYECVCRTCWPEYARVRYGLAKVSPMIASNGDAGGACCTSSTPRRYILGF